MTGERGLTLLEVLVALVVLTLVGLGYVQLFHQSHRLVADSREWSAAVTYAQDAMERAKLGSLSRGAPAESLPVVEQQLPLCPVCGGHFEESEHEEWLSDLGDFLTQPIRWFSGRERSDSFVSDDVRPGLWECATLLRNVGQKLTRNRNSEPNRRRSEQAA